MPTILWIMSIYIKIAFEIWKIIIEMHLINIQLKFWIVVKKWTFYLIFQVNYELYKMHELKIGNIILMKRTHGTVFSDTQLVLNVVFTQFSKFVESTLAFHVSIRMNEQWIHFGILRMRLSMHLKYALNQMFRNLFTLHIFHAFIHYWWIERC